MSLGVSSTDTASPTVCVIADETFLEVEGMTVWFESCENFIVARVYFKVNVMLRFKLKMCSLGACFQVKFRHSRKFKEGAALDLA